MNTQTSSTEIPQTATPETGAAYDEAALIALAGDLTISDEEQERLATIGSPLVREALANNPCLNEIQQRYLAATGSLEVKCKLAKNPSLVDAIQQMFAESDVSEVREALADNRKLNPACQPLLMQDKEGVKHRLIYTLMPLASNPALTENMQQVLADSIDIRVLASLAKNPAISESLMVLLANCDLHEISAGLASNTKLPEHMQAQLIASGHPDVLKNIAQNPSLKSAQQSLLAHEGSFETRLVLLENRGLDAQLKARVASSFTVRELDQAERQLEIAESGNARLIGKHDEALDKCFKAHGGFFSSSDEKIERLNREAERIQAQIDESDREVCRLTGIVWKLRELAKDKSDVESGSINWPGGILAA